MNTSIAVIDYNVTDTAIAELRTRFTGLTVASNKEREIVQKSITEVVKLRTSIEKRRKELKADALEYGRKVDTEAKRVTALLEEIEAPLLQVRDAYDAEQEKIKAEKVRIEKERVDNILANIDAIKILPLQMVGKTLFEINTFIGDKEEEFSADNFNYQEFLGEAVAAKADALAKLEEIANEREKFEVQKAAEEKKRIEAEEENKRLVAERAKLEEEQKAFAAKQAEAARVENERLTAERKAREEEEHKKRQEELTRQAEENKRLAEIEEKRLEVERKELALERERQAHEAKITADNAQAEYEELQRKLKNETMIAQAAPEMLAALEKTEGCICSIYECMDFENKIDLRDVLAECIGDVQAAIAKARGNHE